MAEELAVFDPRASWVKHLERAHDLVHTVARSIGEESEPNAHLAPAARALERGLSAMYDAFDGRADRCTSIGIAHGRLWDAAVLVARAGKPSLLAGLSHACGELVTAEECFPRVRFKERIPLVFRLGSNDLPLHHIERSSLVPSFPAPKEPEVQVADVEVDIPKPTTFAELAKAAETMRQLAKERTRVRPDEPVIDPRPKEAARVIAEVPVGYAFTPPNALSEDEFVRRWARECFDEIGMLGVQRAPLRGDDWRECQVLERRLITAIDALAALGPVAIGHVEPLAMDAPTADPVRVFAVSMIGGCLSGRDALACAERVLFRFGPGDSVVAGAFVSAMKLATNPFVEGMLRSLYASPERGCRAIAVEVLAYREWLTTAELEELIDEQDARVFAHALPALAKARHAGLERALARALAHQDLDVQAAALDAMAIAAHKRAAQAAREAAVGELGDRALMRLAIVGGDDDARWLLGRMKADPTVAAIEAVGWAGLVEAVPALIGLLQHADEEIRFAAGEALEKMLGANLRETIEVEPEALKVVEVVDPNPEPYRGRKPLAELVSDPRDMPPAGSKDTIEVAAIDPKKWKAYWAENAERFGEAKRLRRGHAYSPAVVLYELDKLSLSTEDRRRLVREMAARTGKWVRGEPDDFVVAQERGLRQKGLLP